MTPRTITQNLLYWACALALSVVLSFLGALAQQLPGDAPINWRAIWLDVITTIITLAPVVAAGFGLPRLGKEQVAGLVSEVGAGQAKAVLQVEAIRQATGVTASRPLSPGDVDTLVAAVKAEMLRDPSGTDPLEPERFRGSGI